jgi:RNA 2',3'-cyclic 3'-phosphodiesterase
MHRLFVGIDPPDSIKSALLLLQGGISGVRWQRADQMHITLRFIGEVDRHIANDIAAHLLRIAHPGFDIQLRGVGTFDRRGSLHTLYAGVTPTESLHILHKKINHLLVQLGLEADPRAYVPHLTMARLNHGSGTPAHFLVDHGALATGLFSVNDICLYESQLTRDRAHYSIVERYALSPPDVSGAISYH